MRPVHRLYHLARADFLERVRRHGFLVALLFCVYAGYAFLPPKLSRYATFVMGHHRGVYNSAWVGTAVAILCGAFISLIGFFVIKNAVERDRRTGVGQILATTPISKLQYTLGKTLSNFAVLASMTGIVALASVVMQFVLAEDRTFDAWQMFSPFVLLSLPMLMLTSAVAVFFETMPVLRGGVGNVAFIFVWGFMLGSNLPRHAELAHNDLLGTGVALPGMFTACRAAFPDFDPAHADVGIGVNVHDTRWAVTTFPWHGIDWTPLHVMWRCEWIVAAFALAAIAAIPFDRFDTAIAAPRSRRRRTARIMDANDGAATGTAPESRVRTPGPAGDVALTPLTAGARQARLGAMVWAEWKLMVRGTRWWYAGPLGLTIAASLAPLAAVRAIVLPIAWFWPVLKWSKLGTREAVHNTEPVFFSAPHPLSRQLAATWISGVMLSIMTGAVVALRFVIAGDGHALLAWCAGALFIPALALALGVWTRSAKAFEAIYTGLCYAVIQQAAPLDFMGAVANAPRSNPLVFAVLTVILLVLALYGRRRHLRN